MRTNNCSNRAIVEETFEALVLQMSMLFQSLTDNLGRSQINFLRAFCDGEEHLSSVYVTKKYQLGTSANVVKIKNGLISKEIIDIENNKVVFLDPLYKYWLENYFFKD